MNGRIAPENPTKKRKETKGKRKKEKAPERKEKEKEQEAHGRQKKKDLKGRGKKGATKDSTATTKKGMRQKIWT